MIQKNTATNICFCRNMSTMHLEPSDEIRNCYGQADSRKFISVVRYEINKYLIPRRLKKYKLQISSQLEHTVSFCLLEFQHIVSNKLWIVNLLVKKSVFLTYAHNLRNVNIFSPNNNIVKAWKNNAVLCNSWQDLNIKICFQRSRLKFI